ncbi:MAG: DUF2891 domain-containing protein [Deltaproteobacteria bacterium]|nr:DUF2891 domain-containing protein [Deltaproteobacteria bacterium]
MLELSDPGPFDLDAAGASRFAALSLACTERAWPNKPSHVYEAEAELRPPAELTPAFFGCFDWHSAVHGHWAMARLLGRVEGLREADAIRARLDAHLTPERLARERDFLALERSLTFERPYGWGWLFRLHAELASHPDPDFKRWAAAARPLYDLLAARFRDYLSRLSAPVRAGTHPNTAFAMSHALDAARSTGDEELARAVAQRARDFFLADRSCPLGYEPSGEDFISPCLAEADLMRRVLAGEDFARWLSGFLPAVSSPAFGSLTRPPEVRDRTDPRIGHLIGLDFHRAWCLRGIARALPASDPRRPVFERLARIHAAAGLEQMEGSGYGGEHWLASFAIYLLTDAGLRPAL